MFSIDEIIDANELSSRLMNLQRSYGPGYEHSLQNLFDSHDTPRIATQIRNPGSPYNPDAYPNQEYKVGAPTNKELQVLSLMAVFQLSWPGAPMIYYGTETKMWGADDPDDRKPMIWSDLQYEAEKNHPYRWERGVDSVGFNTDLFEHYSGLVQLRMNSEALRKGELSVFETDNPKVLAYERISEKDAVLVIINHQGSVFWIESKLWNQVSAKYFTVVTSQGQKTDPRVNQHVQNYEVRSNGLVIQEKKRGILPYSYVIYRAHR